MKARGIQFADGAEERNQFAHRDWGNLIDCTKVSCGQLYSHLSDEYPAPIACAELPILLQPLQQVRL